MGLFDFLKKKENSSYPIPANPLHDVIYAARTQIFSAQSAKGCVMMVGDSITAGAENFPDLFPGIINQGIPGDTTLDVRKRLGLIAAQYPSKIFLLIGTNNLGSWLATDTTVKKDFPTVTNKLMMDYIEILNYFKNNLPNTIVYVQSILPINNIMPGTCTSERGNVVIQQLNQVLMHCTYLSDKFKFVDLYPKFLDPTGAVMDLSYTDDGLHPNRKGYEVWSSIIMPLV